MVAWMLVEAGAPPTDVAGVLAALVVLDVSADQATVGCTFNTPHTVARKHEIVSV